jgi:hypothetical protein
MKPQRPLEYPNGKRFAFTVVDDTDVATVQNVAPVYALLERLGMRATKTVWAMGCPEGSKNFSSSQTLQDPAYEEFVRDLQRRGFEIASHGATMESSTRERTRAALDRFRAVVGAYPRVHANHAANAENLYWGEARVDRPVLRRALRMMSGDYYQGHLEGSPFWWGDLCQQHVQYVRNLTFAEINLLRVNPTLPYRDPSRPLVRWWFSAADAEDADAFCALLGHQRQERLERENGLCIVATHFGKGFAQDGRVARAVEERLRELAGRNGWFPTVGEMLDWMRARQTEDVLSPAEWRRMQWTWARDLLWRKARELSRRGARVVIADGVRGPRGRTTTRAAEAPECRVRS